MVYTIRRRELDHAWKIGIIAGAIADVVVTAMGSIALGVEISYGSLIFGNILAVIVGMILELFLSLLIMQEVNGYSLKMMNIIIM